MSKTFKRGNGPLVSILLPTRFRSQHLCDAIDSLYSLAIDKNNLEFILKIDEDDVETIAVYKRMKDIFGDQISAIISPRGNGYLDMHLWVSEMARKAKGDWLFLFNDDARMTTRGWDKGIENANPSEIWHGLDDVCLMVCPTIDRPLANEFIILRKEIFNLLGYFSINSHCDNWIYFVMGATGSAFRVPIAIQHFSGIIGDQIRKESEAAYYVLEKEINTISVIREKMKDVEKILMYIEKRIEEEKRN